MKVKLLLTMIGICGLTVAAEAAEIMLNNGDKVSGEIVSDSSYRIVVETKAMGEVVVDRDFVKSVKTDRQIKEEELAAKQKEDLQWTRKVTLSYTQKGGNDEKGSGSADLYVNRKTPDDEATLKWNAFIDTDSEGSLDSRKFYGMLRYANSFGEEKKWFQFGRVEGSKDNTSNVDYRITPSYGVGYWFYDEPDFKLRADIAAGWEYTAYDDGSDSKSEAVLTPSAHLVKNFENGIGFIQDITLYPSLEQTDFRLRSESALTGKITDQLSWKFSFIDDYDSDPQGDEKKNDYQLISGLEYAF